jgi:hypothetical protein
MNPHISAKLRIVPPTARKFPSGDAGLPIYNWFTEGFDTADLKDASCHLCVGSLNPCGY